MSNKPVFSSATIYDHIYEKKILIKYKTILTFFRRLYFPYLNIDVRDTFDLRRYRSNISVGISNHDEEEGEAEEAVGFEVIFVALECQMWRAGRKGFMFEWSRVFSVFE